MKYYFCWRYHIITRAYSAMYCACVWRPEVSPSFGSLEVDHLVFLKTMVFFLTLTHWLGYAAWPAASRNFSVSMSPGQAKATMFGSFWESNLGLHACVTRALPTLVAYDKSINCYFSNFRLFLMKYLCSWNIWQFPVSDIHNATQPWLPSSAGSFLV